MNPESTMKLNYLQAPWKEWTKRLPKTKEHPRNWVTTVDIEVVLSDGYVLKRPAGTIWDGASIPKWLWWLFKPFDRGGMGDWIHDELWKDKQGQLEHFDWNIYEARKFADDERNRWRKELSSRTKIKNFITHWTVRILGGVFYSRQIQIPN